MAQRGVSFWKPFPFLRIILPFAAGILLQYYFYLIPPLLWLLVAAGLVLAASATWLSLSRLYRLRWLPGTGLSLVFLGLGCLVLEQRQIENRADWIGKSYTGGEKVIATILEPLVEKPRSFKAVAETREIMTPGGNQPVKGRLLLYFQKDSGLAARLGYGTRILISKPLQPISNTGNPGGFDYKRYCAFQDIHHQVYLRPEDYQVEGTDDKTWFKETLINARMWVLSTLRTYIHGPDELAVAEALLIGYRDDLDKELVQAYSNTGVVHIIAISGLHLGMIYAAMIWLLSPLRGKRGYRFIKPISILLVLWGFSFLAGAGPSILRSAVMFSCIVAGESFGRRTSIYNTLAASAFLLLLFEPYFLWDVGFQLSYTAVLGIVAFSKPVSNWFYFRNKLLSHTWRLSAISIAAQVLTLPVVLYYFHQFPNLFLFTNLFIVPLSGLVLFGGIALLAASFIPLIASKLAVAVEWLTWLMNTFIRRTDQLPFAVTDGIGLSFPSALLLFAAISFLAAWFLRKKPELMWVGIATFAILFAGRGVAMLYQKHQQKLVVYNIPRHTAIDVIDGESYLFLGSPDLQANGFLRNFHLRPSRIHYGVSPSGLTPPAGPTVSIDTDKGRVMVLRSAPANTDSIKAAAVVITGSPRISIRTLAQQFSCNLFVFDASNPAWKIRLWKKECDSLHLRHHSVPDAGAFVMDL